MSNDNAPSGREQETDQQNRQPLGQQQQQGEQASQSGQTPGENSQSPDGAASSGQASYGNSGQSDTLDQSRNPSDLGQGSDMGQASSAQDSGFIGSQSSGDDTGSASLSAENAPEATAQQDFAEQGQGAQDDESDSVGKTDIEAERSQGRDSDIEGSSL